VFDEHLTGDQRGPPSDELCFARSSNLHFYAATCS